MILSLQLPFAVVPLVAVHQRPAPRWATFVNPLWVKVLAWTVGRDHRRAERVAAVSDADRRCRLQPCTGTSSSPSKIRPADQTILSHVTSAREATGAALLLVHVADGWAARNYDAQAAESEEMRDDRDVPRAAGAASSRPTGFRADELAMGDPATEIVRAPKRTASI